MQNKNKKIVFPIAVCNNTQEVINTIIYSFTINQDLNEEVAYKLKDIPLAKFSKKRTTQRE